jgi:hypothetical protein
MLQAVRNSVSLWLLQGWTFACSLGVSGNWEASGHQVWASGYRRQCTSSFIGRVQVSVCLVGVSGFTQGLCPGCPRLGLQGPQSMGPCSLLWQLSFAPGVFILSSSAEN